MFELFTEDVVKSNSFVLFHHFDVKLEFARGERSSEVISWEKWVAQLTLPSPNHCNIYINIIKIVYVD